MTRSASIDAVERFYQTHPISEHQILEKLEAQGISRAGLTEDVLQDYDQDHFGGVAANDALAALAGIGPESQVLDVCCGLGGPARYLAQTHGCRVTGIDLTDSRVAGAEALSALVGLSERVSFVCGNALEMPFGDAAFDVVISQEAFCHVPDKPRLIAECSRVLKPGGRMAFTDILATDRTQEATRTRLGREMTFCELATAEQYRALFEAAGCRVADTVDLGAEWAVILKHRLAMYRGLEGQTVARFGQDHFDAWDSAYSFFVAQFETGELTGARILARRGEDI